MKISGIVYIHIIYTFTVFGINPSGLHNNLNPRLELLAGMNDDLPARVAFSADMFLKIKSLFT